MSSSSPSVNVMVGVMDGNWHCANRHAFSNKIFYTVGFFATPAPSATLMLSVC